MLKNNAGFILSPYVFIPSELNLGFIMLVLCRRYG
nr:MAG TPA: hypothetical protein [Caudoviricetes sp.]